MLHLQPLMEAQPYLTSSISCKQILENSDHFLVEIKKVDQGDIFENLQWLKVSKDLSEVKTLTLRAIDSSFEIEERFFDEGYLKFNHQKGIFIEKFNSGQHHYQSNGKEHEPVLIHFLYHYFFGPKTMVN